MYRDDSGQPAVVAELHQFVLIEVRVVLNFSYVHLFPLNFIT
jgi:hypothetical protein